MLAMGSASVVPAIERWGVLVTNLGAAVVLSLGALYVFDPRLLLFALGSHRDSLNTGYGRFRDDSTHFTDDVQLPINFHRVLWTTICFGEELRA